MISETDDFKGAHGAQDVSLEEKMEALDYVSNWLTATLMGHTSKGAFSEAALGCPAVEYFSMRAYEKLFSGKWKWKETKSLKTQLVDIAKSDMGHAVRDWVAKGSPDVTPMSQEEGWEGRSAVAMTDQELVDEIEVRKKSLDMAYEIAEAKAKDDPELLKYLKAMRETKSYRGISKRLKINMGDVKALEARLMALLM